MEYIIRAVLLSDAERLSNIYAYYVTNTAVTFEYDVPDSSEFKKRISKTIEEYPYLVAEYDGKVVGYAYAGAFHARAAYLWAAEVSIYVDNEYRRSGVGRLLYEKLESILKEMGITNLYACIAAPETDDEYLTHDSINFHEKMGYTVIGEFHSCGYKFGRWYNMVWAEKIIGEHLSAQPPVRFFGHGA